MKSIIYVLFGGVITGFFLLVSSDILDTASNQEPPVVFQASPHEQHKMTES